MTQNDHQHNHQHKHDHAHEHATKTATNTYKWPFLLIFAFAFVELAGGIFTQSLALLSDAWHMFSDVFALGLAWFAAHLSAKPGTHTHGSQKHTNGQSHAEITAAAINALLMLAIVVYIIVEAMHRFKNPQAISGGYVMLIAFLGLVVNVIVAKMLHGEHAHDQNKQAAYLHVLGDLLGSVAAVAAGAVIYFTGWLAIDPLLSIFISLLILFVTLKLIKDIWQAYKNG